MLPAEPPGCMGAAPRRTRWPSLSDRREARLGAALGPVWLEPRGTLVTRETGRAWPQGLGASRARRSGPAGSAACPCMAAPSPAAPTSPGAGLGLEG